MKQPKILVVGSYVMDLITSTERVPGSGETVLGSSFTTAPGGKGANQAMQAARLGAATTMVGKVGADDFGRALIDSSRSAGINVEHVMVNPDISSAVGAITLELSPDGNKNRIIVVSGANMTIVQEDIGFLPKIVKGYDMVMLQHEIPEAINKLVARWAAEAGVPVMLNPAPYAPVSDELAAALSFISPNEHEAGDMTGIKIETLADAERAARKLQQRGIDNVLITLGSQGAALAMGDHFVHSPCIESIKAVDPTAAGDSFVAAFCTAICTGAQPEDALEFANYTASLTVSRMGAQPSLPTVAEVAALMEELGAKSRGSEMIQTLKECVK